MGTVIGYIPPKQVSKPAAEVVKEEVKTTRPKKEAKKEK